MPKDAQDHREAELKFELDGGAARKVRRHKLLAKSGHDTKTLTSVYFDTDRGDIHKAGFSLRIRQADDCFTQTVKTNGAGAGLFDRGEWEQPVEKMAPDPEALKQTPLGRLKKLHGKLDPTVCSEVERTTWLVDLDGSVVEVVLDSGSVRAGGEEAPFHELELELRDGEPAAMFDFAQALAEGVPLEIGVLSKEERGRLLGCDMLDHAHKSVAPSISKEMDAAQAFMAVVTECVRHFRLNETLIVAERDPAALHQARVAMRRLRTAFTLFRPVIRQATLEPLRKELHAFIEPFGEARNLDVFLANHGDDLSWRDRRKLKAARADAYDRVAESLNGQPYRDMMLDLVEWTASGDWRKGAASEPIGQFSEERLDTAWRKVTRKGRKLGDLDEQQLHRLRIKIKELRYAVEFLAPLYRRKHVRAFTSSLEAMQDCLGLLHDDMVSRQIIADFAVGAPERTDATARTRKVKEMVKRFNRLRRVGRFWAN